jgi:hypothetical protein
VFARTIPLIEMVMVPAAGQAQTAAASSTMASI